MANTTAMKRGWHWDEANSKLSVYVDGVEAGYFTTAGAYITVAGTGEVTFGSDATYPTTSDSNALGTTSNMWSDLFLASGGVINFNNGDVTITHSSGALAVAATWATASATGRPFGVTLTVNAALGSYSNAVKGYVTYGASGKTTGLGSAVNAEISLSAGTSDGTYCPLESELVLGSGASTGTQTGFIYCNASGAGVATFDTNGYFLVVGTGVTPAAGKFASATSQTLKCSIDGSTRYLVFSQAEDGLALGSSGTAQSYTAGTPPINCYFTAAGSGSTNCEPVYVKSTVTGTSPVGGRARFHTYSNVAAGGWLNSLKGYTEFGSSGSVSGLGSGICGEVVLSAGTSSGTYAGLESEISCGSGASTGTATSHLYCNGTDTDGTLNDNAYLFEIGAIYTSDAAHMWYDNTSGVGDEFIRVKTPNGARYLILSDSTDLS